MRTAGAWWQQVATVRQSSAVKSVVSALFRICGNGRGRIWIAVGNDETAQLARRSVRIVVKA
ncbi:MAG: hypothetical protein R2867_00210 [Caldilineaceae bacterium]